MTKRSLRDALSTDSCVNILLQELDVMDKEIRRFGRILRGNLSENNKTSISNSQEKMDSKRNRGIVSENQCISWLDSVVVSSATPGDFSPHTIGDMLSSEDFFKDLFSMEAEMSMNPSYLLHGAECPDETRDEVKTHYSTLENSNLHSQIQTDNHIYEKTPEYDANDSGSDSSSEIMQSSPCSPTTLAQTLTKLDEEEEGDFMKIRINKSNSNNFDSLYKEKNRSEIVCGKSTVRDYRQEVYP